MTDTTETIDSLPSWAQKIIRDLRSEAAQHRQDATEAQAERDTLREELSGIHTKAALDGLKDKLADPEDLGRYVDTATLVDDNGKPDPDKYADAATALVTERPHLGIAKPPAGRSGNPVGGARPHAASTPDPAAQAAAGTADFVAMVQDGF
ncbi:hypothetical protein [Rhodococcus sp. Q]|uniref:hypothetical protein n=1 Tax=Rhodococcus sp. Q TaxID=2502252 RepID=UPI0010F5197D|nr:hypothetical protein [Rhodococcus sp. Q]